tara:strand:- start:1942 stop:2532 length:591 start_codon:yes stop_codon:yes gene_type:complete
MASDVQIAKLALQHIGDRWDITALDDASPEAEQVNLIFEDTRDALLRAHPWGFAKKFTSPAALTGTVPGNWDYMYTYMTDALTVRGIIDPTKENLTIKFEVARNDTGAKVILTNQEDPEFVYTQAITDPNEFDPQFVLAFSYMLASRLAIPLTGDGSIAQAMLQQALISVGAAEETDSNEGIEPDKPEASWITARL